MCLSPIVNKVNKNTNLTMVHTHISTDYGGIMPKMSHLYLMYIAVSHNFENTIGDAYIAPMLVRNCNNIKYCV